MPDAKGTTRVSLTTRDLAADVVHEDVEKVQRDVSTAAAANDGPVLVTTSAQLEAAMNTANAGRTIRVRAGTYLVTKALVVPNGASVLGEGQMQMGAGGLPQGFAPGTRTTIRAAATLVGDVITLGNGSRLHGLAIEDAVRTDPKTRGNVVMVSSGKAHDSVAAEIDKCEIKTPNTSDGVLNGPSGRAVVVITRTIRDELKPPVAHHDSTLDVRIDRSILKSSQNGSSVFAINFAPRSHIKVSLNRNVLSSLDANGGVSRPLQVVDSRVEIDSQHNLYRVDGTPPAGMGWLLTGGGGPPPGVFPPNIPGPATERNTLRIRSAHDRIEGFAVGIHARGAMRNQTQPPAGPSNDNRLFLDLSRLKISSLSTDLRLFGAQSVTQTLTPGDRNLLCVCLHHVTGSGPRNNVYGHAVGGPSFTDLVPPFAGVNNRLEIVEDKFNNILPPPVQPSS
jgi:hypothetical protein